MLFGAIEKLPYIREDKPLLDNLLDRPYEVVSCQKHHTRPGYDLSVRDREQIG